MEKTTDISCICNALIDTLFNLEDDTVLSELDLHKGRTHLIDQGQRSQLLGKVKDLHHQVELGGSGMNVARAAAQLGSKISFTGMVGEDDYGNEVVKRLEQLGIFANIARHPQEETGSCSVLVSKDGERTLNTYLGASSHYQQQHLPEEVLKSSKVLHFTGYQWDKPNQVEAIQKAIAIAKSAKTLISLDVSDPFVAENHRDPLQALIQKDIDILFANKEEAICLYGDFETAKQKLKEANCLAVIKLGAEGAWIQRSGEEFTIPAHAVEVVDTTGAGDSFAAGFLHGFVKGYDLKTSATIAVRLAADVITRLGVFYEPSVIAELRQVKSV